MLNMAQFAAKARERNLNIFNVRVLQNGNLVGKLDLTEDIRRLQHSVSKSFTSMAVGLAIDKGKLTLETTLKDVFPEYVSPLKQTPPSMQPGDITLFDLLRMSTGHDSPPFWAEERLALKDKNWVQHYLSLTLDRAPGEIYIQRRRYHYDLCNGASPRRANRKGLSGTSFVCTSGYKQCGLGNNTSRGNPWLCRTSD